MSALTGSIEKHWAEVAPLLTIRNEHEYDAAIGLLNALLDEVAVNEAHPLYGLVDTLGTLIHDYEERHHQLPDVGGAEMLRYFLDEHGLTQADIPEVGSQGVVSELLSGKRQLNVRQARALALRFRVSPAVFI
jgi:HTH-type transcriptional regulator/antitoxin HigA